MGWGDVISIGLGLGNLAVNASNATTLQQMKMQQASEQFVREFLNMLRNGMFKLNQAAEDVLRSEATDPLRAAGAMRILDYQLVSSGVTPELFTDLGDKKFAADTARLISENSNRMYAALDVDGQVQVNLLVDSVRRLPDLHYYLENVDNAHRLDEANTVVSGAGLAGAPSCLVAVGVMIAVYFVLALALAFNDILGLVLMLAAGAGILALGVRYSKKRKAVTEARKTIKDLEGKIDLEHFRVLEKQLQLPEKARQEQEQAEQFVESFFGDYSLLDEGWRS